MKKSIKTQLLTIRSKLFASLAAFVLVAFAFHMAPIVQQSPCDPGFFAEAVATVLPSAHAQQSGCNGYCEAMQCSFGGEICSSGCYDGMWTYCVEPAPGDDGGEDQEEGP